MSKKKFGELAVEKELINRSQLYDCLAEQERLREAGEPKLLSVIMHDRELLTLDQVNELLTELEGSKRREQIEGYQIISRIGKGGMGSVYLAKQKKLGRLVAIKVLPPRLAQNEDYLARFRREAAATAALNHPNIVQALDFGVSNGYNFFVMEYVDGDTLKGFLEAHGVIEEHGAVELAIRITSALEHAWKHEIVHRDIKPANIMIDKDGIVKLCDLGLAIRGSEDLSITRAGVIMGTPYYLSPEQAKMEELDTRSDIYSLGATLYHMVTGKLPFEGADAAEAVSKHLTAPLPDPRTHNPALSDEITRILMKMMEKKRADRYADPTELIADLEALQFGTAPPVVGGLTVAGIRPGKRRGILPRLVAATLLVGCLAGGAYLVTENEQIQKKYAKEFENLGELRNAMVSSLSALANGEDPAEAAEAGVDEGGGVAPADASGAGAPVGTEPGAGPGDATPEPPTPIPETRSTARPTTAPARPAVDRTPKPTAPTRTDRTPPRSRPRTSPRTTEPETPAESAIAAALTLVESAVNDGQPASTGTPARPRGGHGITGSSPGSLRDAFTDVSELAARGSLEGAPEIVVQHLRSEVRAHAREELEDLRRDVIAARDAERKIREKLGRGSTPSELSADRVRFLAGLDPSFPRTEKTYGVLFALWGRADEARPHLARAARRGLDVQHYLELIQAGKS